MPETQYYPLPKNGIVEEHAELTRFVDLRVPERIIKVDIFLKKK